jgi:hypothetical protein
VVTGLSRETWTGRGYENFVGTGAAQVLGVTASTP